MEHERIDARDPDDFLCRLMSCLKQGYASDVVFRGESSCFSTVLPSALRGPVPDDGFELAYFAETFLHTHGGAIQGRDGTMLSVNDVWTDRLVEFESLVKSTYLYALAQHHGVATRLLDVTLNPLVAAYFAVDYRWRSDTGDRVRVLVMEAGRLRGSGCTVVEVPPHANARLHRQRGAFLGSKRWDSGETVSLLDMAKGAYQEITLGGRYADHLRLMLQRLGCSPTTLYGDMDAVGAEARWRSKVEHMMLAPPPEDG